MSASVPTQSMNYMCISIAISVLLPIALLLYFRVRKHANILPFFVGCAVMLVFAFVLEQIVHSIVLTSPAGTRLADFWPSRRSCGQREITMPMP